MFASYRYGNFLGRCFLGLFDKTVCQDKEGGVSEEAKESENIATELHTYFPNALSINQFLEVLAWHDVQFFNQA